MIHHKIACRTSLGTKITCAHRGATALPKRKSPRQLRSAQRFAAGVSTQVVMGTGQIRHGGGKSLHLIVPKGNQACDSVSAKDASSLETRSRRNASRLG